MFNRLAAFNNNHNLHNLELMVDLYSVSSSYVAVCPKLDIFIHSESQKETLRKLAKSILNFFDVSNVEIIDRFKNKIMTKYKMKFIIDR